MGLGEIGTDDDKEQDEEQQKPEEQEPDPTADKTDSNYESWRGTGESPSCPSCGYGGVTTAGRGFRCDNQGCGVIVYLDPTELSGPKSEVETPEIDDFLDQYSIPDSDPAE